MERSGLLDQKLACYLQERDIAVVEYFKRPWWKWALFWILGPLSGLSVWLACLWSLSFRTALMFAPASIQDAEFVFIEVC